MSRDVVIEETIREPKQTVYEQRDDQQNLTDSVGADDQQDDLFDKNSNSTDYESINSTSDEDFVIDLPQSHDNAGIRKSQRITKPKQFEDYVTYACMQGFSSDDNDDPVTVEEAMSRSDAELWKRAMYEEMQCFEDNDAWELMDGPPDSTTVVPCKWVFKRKISESGEVKYRARLVAKGCVQKAGVDYGDVFSPVVRHSTLRLLIALAVRLDLKITHIDVKTAFLNSSLEQPVYMR